MTAVTYLVKTNGNFEIANTYANALKADKIVKVRYTPVDETSDEVKKSCKEHARKIKEKFGIN